MQFNDTLILLKKGKNISFLCESFFKQWNTQKSEVLEKSTFYLLFLIIMSLSSQTDQIISTFIFLVFNWRVCNIIIMIEIE